MMSICISAVNVTTSMFRVFRRFSFFVLHNVAQYVYYTVWHIMCTAQCSQIGVVKSAFHYHAKLRNSFANSNAILTVSWDAIASQLSE